MLLASLQSGQFLLGFFGPACVCVCVCAFVCVCATEKIIKCPAQTSVRSQSQLLPTVYIKSMAIVFFLLFFEYLPLRKGSGTEADSPDGQHLGKLLFVCLPFMLIDH